MTRPLAVRLDDGTVLVASGFYQTDPYWAYMTDLFRYDPQTGEFTLATRMSDLTVQALVPLRDGTVLLHGVSNLYGRAQANLFDPVSGTTRGTGSMLHRRAGFTATRLLDGRVLIADGSDGTVNPSRLPAEIYDPVAGAYSETGVPLMLRVGGAAAILADGRALLAGGCDVGFSGGYFPYVSEAEVYDPATGEFTPTGWMFAPRHDFALLSLPGGDVIAVGGGPLRPERYVAR